MTVAITDSTVILGLITGKASGSLVGDLALIASEPGDLIAGINSTNYISDDGPNATTQAHGGITATQYAIMLIQTDLSESKKRVGLYKNGFTWSAWGTFDLSFDLALSLDVLVNSETMTLDGLGIYNSLLSEADIKAEIIDLEIHNLPTVDTISPADGALLPSATTVTLSAKYHDADGDTGSLRFYNDADDALIGTASGLANGATGTVNWTGLTPGSTYAFYVIPADTLEDGAATSAVTFSINAKPTADSFSPADGAILPAAMSVTLSAKYHDAGAGSLRFYNDADDSLIGTAIGLTDGETGSVVWSGLIPGNTYAYYVIPEDAIEDGATSAVISFDIAAAGRGSATIYGTIGKTINTPFRRM